MSIQAGIWNFNGEPVDRTLLNKISMQTSDYGSDGEALHIDANVALLYRPLHTTAESRLERQPYLLIDGKVITWDGRLDNRDELIGALKVKSRAPTFPGTQAAITDVEIVAAALERWGTNSFARLLGDWAVSIWDSCNEQLILARDYSGVRHLFYHLQLHTVVWCSTLAPLIQSAGGLTLCEQYIADYLVMWPEAHQTPYREIHSVPPGYFVCIDSRRSVVQHSFWTFDPSLRIRYRTDAGYEEHFRHLLRSAICCRLRADSPILAGLSGGLDSSSIVCVADDILANNDVAVPSLETFSFYDPDEPDEEDFEYFTKIEQKRGRTGHRLVLKGVGDTFMFPPAFTGVPGFGVRQELAVGQSEIMRRHKYSVLLSGVGGDEFLGQALDPRVQMADSLAMMKMPTLATQLVAWSSVGRRPLVQLLLQALVLLLPTGLRSWSTATTKYPPWITRGFARKHRMPTRLLVAGEGRWYWLPSVRDSFQTQATLARIMTYIQPSSEETRYPYLDRRLVEFLMSIPTDQLLRPGESRSLMRRALAHLLPPEILRRRTKASTGRCAIITLNKHWQMLEAMFAPSLSSHLGYISDATFQAALQTVRNGQIHQLSFVIKTLSLEFWLRQAVAQGIVLVPGYGQELSIEPPTTRKMPQMHMRWSVLHKEKETTSL
jgi:asparagine synthase (glutamine-hydrolysing)